MYGPTDLLCYFSFYNSAQTLRLSCPKHPRGGIGGWTQRQTVSYESKRITSRDIDKLLFGRVPDRFTNYSPELSKKCTFHHSHDKVKNRTGVALKAAIHVGNRWRRGVAAPWRWRGKHGALPTSSVLSRYHYYSQDSQAHPRLDGLVNRRPCTRMPPRISPHPPLQ